MSTGDALQNLTHRIMALEAAVFGEMESLAAADAIDNAAERNRDDLNEPDPVSV